MAHIERDGVRLYVDDRGHGGAVLLVHGHTLDHRVWEEVTPRLVAGGRRSVAPDLRGHGRSTRPVEGYHPLEHARDMRSVLDGLAIDRAVVVGYSLGGGIALEMAIAWPDRVHGLVLVEPVLPDRPYEAEFFATLKEVARVVRAEGVREAMLGPWTDSELFSPSFRRPGLRERFQAIVRDFPGADYLAVRRDRVERDWTVPDRLATLDVPTAVLSAEHTLPGFGAWAEEIAAHVPGARHEIVPDTGHLLPMERPDAVADTVLGLAPIS
jgi:pimeloyl-ACP methyl ester carboxylesterase